MLKREFVVADAQIYDRTSPVRWIISHVLHYRRWVTSFFLATIVANLLSAYIPVLTGDAFNEILRAQPDASRLLLIALGILGLVFARAGLDLVGRFSAEILGKRFKRDAREELYASLLGKSQTFHNRQRVGDLMARAANDVDQLSNMIVPGVDAIVDSFSLGIICLIFIGFLKFELLLAPLLFTAVFVIALRVYARELGPVAGSMRGQFGRLNAVLTEAVTGIEVVKSTAQEPREKGKFDDAPPLPRFLRQERADPGALPAAAAPDDRHGWRISPRSAADRGGSDFGGNPDRLHGADERARLPRLHVDLHLLPRPARAGWLGADSRDHEGRDRARRERGRLRDRDSRRDRLRERHLSLRRRAGPEERLVPSLTRPDRRDRRADRFGEEHPDQAGEPDLRRDGRADPDRRRRRARVGASSRCARRSRRSSRTSFSSRVRSPRTSPSAWARRPTGPRSKPPRTTPRPTASSAGFRTATRRSSASVASPSPAASASAWRSPARC